MAKSEDELRMQLDLDIAAAKKRKEDLETVDVGAVGTGAEEGALAGALTLPAAAWYARSRGIGTPRPVPSAFSPHGGKAERLAAAASGVAREIAESAVRNPKTFAALEVAGGAGAGAGAELARQETKEDSPEAQDIAGLAGSVAGGVTAAGLPGGALNVMRRFFRWGMNDLPQLISALPITGAVANRIPGLGGVLQRKAETAATDRAALALQSRTGDPEAAAAAAKTGPTGVTPARRTGEEGLMSVEAAIAKEDPVFRASVDKDLEAAIGKAQGDMRDLYSTPRGRQDWERTVVQRVAAPGAELEGSTPSELLDSAEKSFGPLYDDFRDWGAKARLVGPQRKTPLLVMFRNAMNSRTTMAGDDTRRSVGRWLEGKMSALARRTDKDGNITVGDLLSLRSDIRASQRQVRDSTSPNSQDKLELLELAEDRVNQVIKGWLPKDEWTKLAGVDRQYGAYKTVANAVRRSKDRELTPDNLLAELRYGKRADLRSMAEGGRDVSEVLGDPDRARIIASQMAPADLQNMRNGYAHELMNRATVVDKDGGRGIDGLKLQKLLQDNYAVGRSLGMSHEELGRLDNMASQLRNMQRPSPEAAAKIMSDGPSDILQLATSLAASKVSREVTKATGAGSSLVFTGFLSRYYKKLLNSLTGDRAVQLLIDASRDPDLYSALLLRKTARPVAHQQAARRLNAWLATVAAPQATDVGDDLIQNLRDEANSLRNDEE